MGATLPHMTWDPCLCTDNGTKSEAMPVALARSHDLPPLTTRNLKSVAGRSGGRRAGISVKRTHRPTRIEYPEQIGNRTFNRQICGQEQVRLVPARFDRQARPEWSWLGGPARSRGQLSIRDLLLDHVPTRGSGAVYDHAEYPTPCARRSRPGPSTSTVWSRRRVLRAYGDCLTYNLRNHKSKETPANRAFPDFVAF